ISNSTVDRFCVASHVRSRPVLANLDVTAGDIDEQLSLEAGGSKIAGLDEMARPVEQLANGICGDPGPIVAHSELREIRLSLVALHLRKGMVALGTGFQHLQGREGGRTDQRRSDAERGGDSRPVPSYELPDAVAGRERASLNRLVREEALQIIPE